MDNQRFCLPFPPSVNRYWRHVKIKDRMAVLISKEGRQYAKDVAAAVQRQGVQHYAEDKLEVFLGLCPPDKRRRDVDNYTKATLDALTKSGVWGDDSQAKILHVYMLEPKAGGMLWVEVRSICRNSAQGLTLLR